MSITLKSKSINSETLECPYCGSKQQDDLIDTCRDGETVVIACDSCGRQFKASYDFVYTITDSYSSIKNETLTCPECGSIQQDDLIDTYRDGETVVIACDSCGRQFKASYDAAYNARAL